MQQRLVNELMDARQAVKAAETSGDLGDKKTARAAVQAAKVARGEREQIWWMTERRT